MNKLLLFLIIPFLSFGQGWIQTYEDQTQLDYATQTNTGNYAFIHYSSSYSVGFCLTNESGDVIVEQFMYEDILTSGRCVQQTNDNGYVIIANHWQNGESSIYKFDINGNLSWSIKNESIGGSYIEQTNDGGYITIGSKLTKLDSAGNIEWFNEAITGTRVHQTNNDGYIIGGHDTIFKTDENGEEEWSLNLQSTELSLDGFFYDYSNISQTIDGGYLAIMNYEYMYFGNDYCLGIYLVKLNENGVQEWIQDINSTTYNFGLRDGRSTSDGGAIIVGARWDMAYDEADIWLMKIDNNGAEQWNVLLDDYGCAPELYSIEQTSDDGYLVAGQNCGMGLLIKTNPEGNVTSTNIIEIPTINKKLITKVDILGKVTNNKGFQLHIYDDGSVEKKYLIK